MRKPIVLATILLLPVLVSAGEPTIRVLADTKGMPSAFAVAGLATERLNRLAAAADGEQWQSLFAVYVASDGAQENELPAMLGDYRLEGTELRFTPKYALRPGMRYRAVLRPQQTAATAKAIVQDILIPEAPRGQAAKVVAVYPSADALPENLLKFYLHFSAPMSRGEVYEHVQLLNDEGKPVEMPFLEIGEEFWSRDGRRLMLLIDPGRIKRGVKPREDLGPALVAGQKYTLAIDRGWQGADGQPLAGDFRKRFTATAPVEVAIDQSQWKLIPPPPGLTDPLVVNFPHPLDHALLQSALTVLGPGDEARVGRIRIADHERRWEFRPERPWDAGKYELVIDTVLEDLAGNRIGLPFEVDQLDRIETRVQSKFVRLPFEVSRASE